MLVNYAKEFVAVGQFLMKQKDALRKGYILVEKSKLVKMLDRNAYDTAHNKLRIWKALNWIDADTDNHLAKKVYEEATGRYKRYIKLDAAVLEQLKKLL